MVSTLLRSISLANGGLQSIMEYNGGSVIAMVGKECVAIAADLRFGTQGLGISSNFQRVRVIRCNLACLLTKC